MTAPEVEGVHWFISGRVQGVGFRWFVLHQAQQIGVRGWARNLADGRVEVVGVGNSRALLEFEAALRSGPLTARVVDISRADFPHDTGAFNSFTIR